MSTKIPPIFKIAAKRKITTAIAILLLLTLSIIVLVLSFQQFTVINEFGDIVANWDDFCSNELISYLTPFIFTATFNNNKGKLGCPWRERNTILRLTVDFILVIVTMMTLIVLFTNKFIKMWQILYWFHWLLFVMMFVVFVVDCDGLNTGYHSCTNNFYVEDEQIIHFQGVDYNYIDKCHMIPFINMIFTDLATVIIGFSVYKICSYYSFNDGETSSTKSVNNDTSNIASSKSNNKSSTTSFGGSVYDNVGAYDDNGFGDDDDVDDNTNLNAKKNDDIIKPDIEPITNNTNNDKKDDSPDPFTPFKQENNSGNDVYASGGGGGAWSGGGAYD